MEGYVIFGLYFLSLSPIIIMNYLVRNKQVNGRGMG